MPTTLKNNPRLTTCRPGVTIRDVVVAVFVCAVLVCLLLPWIVRQRASSRRTTCQRRQMTTGKAIRGFEANAGHFPAYRNLQAIDAAGQERPTGWMFPLLPFLRLPEDERVPPRPPTPDDSASDEKPEPVPDPPYLDIYAQYGPDGPDRTRGQTPARFIAEIVCPADPPPDPTATPNWTSWVVNTGMPDAEPSPEYPADWPANGVFFDLFTPGGTGPPGRVSAAFIERHDGLSNTLLMSENVDSGAWTDHGEFQVGFVWIAELRDGVPDPGDELLRINQLSGQGDGSMRFARPSSHHGGGVNVLFASGAFQFLNEDIDYLVFARLMMSNSRGAKAPGSDSPVSSPYRVADSP